MTRVTAADGVLLLLREQLDRHARAKARSTTGAVPTRATPRERIAALAAARTLSDEDLGRAAVRALLAERLGSDIVAEPGYELVVRQIIGIITDTAEGQALLAATRQQLIGD